MCLLDARAAYTALIFAEGRTSKLTLSHKAARASPAAAAATGTKRKDSASSSSEDAAKSITLRVKTTGDGREYKVPVSLTSTIAQAKQNICSVIGAEGKYLRLISSGKMLAPDTAVLSAFKLPDMSFVHCVVSSTAPQQQGAVAVATPAEPEEDENDDPALRRGFDRLRSQGMSRADVTAIRAYFAPQVREHAATLPQPPTPAAADAAATTVATASSTDTVADGTAVAATDNSSNSSTTATTAATAAAAAAEPAVLSDWDRQMLNEECYLVSASLMTLSLSANAIVNAHCSVAKGYLW
eukprot:13915-Heterococcus_DN1.PRE.3